MPEPRRISLLTVGWAGLVCFLGALGCHLQITLPPAESSGAKTSSATQWPARTADGRTMVLTSGVLGPDGQPVQQDALGPGPVGIAGAHEVAPTGWKPTELEKMAQPPYFVEPPDVLLLDTLRMVPRPPYIVNPLDVLIVRVAEPLPGQPIDGTYTVAPDGTINLGYSYGVVRVGGLPLEQVERAIRQQVGRVLRGPQVAVGLAQYRGVQQVRGEHLVRPDGTISLGVYGCVFVAGLRLDQIKVAIERHLSQFVLDPEISVDVLAYNSKVYYVITDGAGYGMQVYRFPITGNETVLDAISNILGLPAVSSTKKMWLARPTPAKFGCNEVLPIDWWAITKGGSTATNYQLFPGDRIYVQGDALITVDNWIAKALSPLNRILSFGLLATSIRANLRTGTGTGGSATAIVVPAVR
jgi:protein involved in polysaccharide export with SLBB domain